MTAPRRAGCRIRTPAGTLVYTGDYRFHGFHPERTRAFAEACRGADLLITEGVTVSNGDVGLGGRTLADAVSYMGNNHGGLIELNGQWYIFYHRHTNRSSFSRQACAEAIERSADGLFLQAELTSCGLNGKPLAGTGEYPAYIACNLSSASGAFFSEAAGENDPYITQDGGDREGGDAQYIANLRNGAWAAFKYFDLRTTTGIGMTVRGGRGSLIVSDGEWELAKIPLSRSEEWHTYHAPLAKGGGRCALYFRYEGKEAIDFKGFTLKS